MLRTKIAGAASALAICAAMLGQARADALKIGVIGPMTGPGAQWGFAARYAAEILADEINAKGGLEVGSKRYTLETIAYDDQYKASEAISAYNRLVQKDGVKYMMVVVSAPLMAVKQMIEDDKIVTITSATAKGAIDEKTHFVTRLDSVPRDYVPGFAAWLKDNISEKRIVQMNPNDETGWTHSEITQAAYKKNGFDIAAVELYERSLKEFAPLLTKNLALHPDVIDLGSSPPTTAALIVRQAREMGYKGRFVQTGGAGWEQIVEGAGKEAAEGLVNVLYADTSAPGFQRLAAAYQKKVGQFPNEFLAPDYDAFNVILKAIQKAGDVNDTAKVAASFKDVMPMKSVQGGDMNWVPQQIITTEYISVLHDGKPVIKGEIK
jgi:branched-chain amino acid transport system substrate-binding protein